MGSAGGLALARHLLQARALASSCSAAGQGGCQGPEPQACMLANLRVPVAGFVSYAKHVSTSPRCRAIPTTPACWSAWLKPCRCAQGAEGAAAGWAACSKCCEARDPCPLPAVHCAFSLHLQSLDTEALIPAVTASFGLATPAPAAPPLLQQPTNQYLLDLKHCTGW